MKNALFWMGIALGLLGLIGCGETGPDNSEAPLPASMKGYELYSWQDGAVWRYTLITGTNRLKSIDEIKGGADEITDDGWVKITVVGEANMREVISRLPEGQEVFWLDRLPGQNDAAEFAYPEAADIRSIEQSCEKNGVPLTLVSG